MSEPKFTPGPWRLSDGSIVTDHLCIAVIEDDGGYEAPEMERKANGNLIAAAPELYEACRTASERCGCSVSERDSGHRSECYMPQIEAALAKAENASNLND